MNSETGAKHVDLLVAVKPMLSRLGVLVTPTSTTYRMIVDAVQSGARSARIATVVVEASTPQEIDAAFARLARENVGAVAVGGAPFFGLHRERIAQLASKYRLPAIYSGRSYVEAGGLMSYGQKVTENYLRVGTYVDRIFKGARPGDLPVEQPTSFELAINQRTARALGLSIPREMLLRADYVID